MPTQRLPELAGTVAMVDGGFDPLHAGHVAYFRAAAELGAPVLCNVSGDHYVRGKHEPLLAEEERAELIAAIRYVDHVHISRTSTEEVLRHLRPRFYVKGADWQGRLPAEQVRICAEQGTEIVYLDTVLNSSSRLLLDFLETNAPKGDGVERTFDQAIADEQVVDRFERAVLEQRPFDPGHYDDEYFTDDWREGDNRYDLETRRRIEARNPELIKEVLAPTRVLDMGCGPGFLMYFLQELGVDVTGVDFSPASRELAPEGVRDRIIIGPTDRPHVEERAYDLVICREVFEHLTVLQVRRTVYEICRASNRFVYATTRFHEDPDDLLDFTTQFDVDPTHITLLNKAFLRCLFVLEGFTRRPDLEERMDWADKRRVLIYERGDGS